MVLEEFVKRSRRQMEEMGHSVTESKAVIKELLFQQFGWNSTQQIMNSREELNDPDFELLTIQIGKVLKGIPTQYVTGKAAFFGMELKVNSSVLIPRPETEELVQLISDRTSPKRILDIGTGSGAIALALKKLFREAEIIGIDLSSDALKVAKENAIEQALEVEFLQMDMTKLDELKKLGSFDLVISNPPYIPIEEKESLSYEVIENEPHMALFSPVNDPIYYYKFIGTSAKFLLKRGGWLALELHPPRSKEVQLFLVDSGLDAYIEMDLAGRERFIIGQKRI